MRTSGTRWCRSSMQHSCSVAEHFFSTAVDTVGFWACVPRLLGSGSGVAWLITDEGMLTATFLLAPFPFLACLNVAQQHIGSVVPIVLGFAQSKFRAAFSACRICSCSLTGHVSALLLFNLHHTSSNMGCTAYSITSHCIELCNVQMGSLWSLVVFGTHVQ